VQHYVGGQEQTNQRVLYTYDVNPLDPGTFQAVNGSTLLANLAATYAWDTQGRMTNMTYPSGPAVGVSVRCHGKVEPDHVA
jgi:hypothetical protein